MKHETRWVRPSLALPGILCLCASVTANPPLPLPPKIGVFGNNACQLLQAQGFNCTALDEKALTNAAVLQEYPLIICDTLSYTSAPDYDLLRAYVYAGGVAFLNYCFHDDLGGCYFADSAAWGPCLRYTIVSNALTQGITNQAVPLPQAWSDKNFSSYGLLEPTSERATVLIRGDFANRDHPANKADPRHVVSNAPWLVQNRFGAGFVLNGLCGAFTHALQTKSPELCRTLSNVVRYAESLSKAKLNSLTSYSASWEGSPRTWPDIEKYSLRAKGKVRTACFFPHEQFINQDARWLAERARRFDADRIDVLFLINNAPIKNFNPEINSKIQALRKEGFLFGMGFGPHIPLSERLPGSAARTEFFQTIAAWAPHVDVIGMDEWYFTPTPGLATQGALDQADNALSFRAQFQKASGLSDTDIDWAFAHGNADDPRARQLWDFCTQIADGFMQEFVQTAKTANPNVRTWISYITHNWNKLASCVDKATAEFDELLNCQTYWYGANADDPLEAAGMLVPIGLGKIMQHEYPQSFLWAGFSPNYAGGRMSRAMRYKWWQPDPHSQYYMHYQNTPAEITPYLALLYAAADGVFIFHTGNQMPRGDGSDLDFADVIRLVAHLVPHIRDTRQHEIGYYYNPRASWEQTRQLLQGYGKCFYRNQKHLQTLGYLQMFCDLAVTADPSSHNKLVVAGPTLEPQMLDNKRQLYLWTDRPWRYPDVTPLTQSDWQFLGITPAENLRTILQNMFSEKAQQLSRRFHLQSIYSNEASCSVTLHPENAFLLRNTGRAQPIRSLKIIENSVVTALNTNGTLINTIDVSLLTHGSARRITGNDMATPGWKTRDCPQLSDNNNLVAVAFREAREAVVDFGPDIDYRHVRLIVFNGTDGITSAETIDYQRGMVVPLAPYSVLVASGQQ